MSEKNDFIKQIETLLGGIYKITIENSQGNCDEFLCTKESLTSLLESFKEIEADRTLRMSQYHGVYRIHLKDGVVDVRYTATTLYPERIIEEKFGINLKTVNGCQIGLTQQEFLDWCQERQISIYQTFS